MTWVNLSEYGRMRGVSSEAVKKAITGGRLPNSSRQKANGKWEVQPEAANIEWELATSHKNRPKYVGDVKPPGYIPIRMPGADRAEPAAPLLDEAGNIPLSRHEATRRMEVAKMRKAELDLAEREGQLTDIAKVNHDAFALARATRDAKQNIPDRVAAEFAGITVPAVIHARLSDEIRKALEGLVGA